MEQQNDSEYQVRNEIVFNIFSMLYRLLGVTIEDYKPKPPQFPDFNKMDLKELAKYERNLQNKINADRSLNYIKKTHYKNEAYTDRLTGLKNYAAFERKLQKLADRNLSSIKNEICLAMIDGDGVKLVNDKYGHGEGDMLLQLIGSGIQGEIDEGEVNTFRIGGDEFAAFYENIPLIEANKSMENISKQIKQDFKETNSDNHRNTSLDMYTGISYGVASTKEIKKKGTITLNDLEKIKNIASTRFEEQKKRKKEFLLVTGREEFISKTIR